MLPLLFPFIDMFQVFEALQFVPALKTSTSVRAIPLNADKVTAPILQNAERRISASTWEVLEMRSIVANQMYLSIWGYW